jgi:hypothetical protein
MNELPTQSRPAAAPAAAHRAGPCRTPPCLPNPPRARAPKPSLANADASAAGGGDRAGLLLAAQAWSSHNRIKTLRRKWRAACSAAN